MYRGWVEAGYFTADPTSDKPPYSIVLPPPNVTGSLHMGHALDHTLMDALTRRKRMQGFEVLWLPGMDHAGIATQTLVEKQLAADGKTKADFGREGFLEKVWEWKAESGGTIGGQMRRLGDGVDWSRERFTMDEGLSRAVRTIFKRLYDAGLIYQAERLVNWSPVLQTAISDLEVKYDDVEGELVSFRYGSMDDAAPHIVVATTRIETMLGDTAIAVHPDDDRYRALVGTTLPHPYLDRDIVIVADEHVDPEFGTGAVKVTPAHDPNDFEIGMRHGLPMPTIMDARGAIAGTGTEFDGMDRFEARVKVREKLAADGRITVMMCNFEQPALILRLYGRGKPVLPQDPEWAELAAQFTLLPGTRQIFDIAVDSVQTSCGWGVPVMHLDKHRETLPKYHAQQDPAAWEKKVAGRTRSIDGLPTRATDRFIAGS